MKLKDVFGVFRRKKKGAEQPRPAKDQPNPAAWPTPETGQGDVGGGWPAAEEAGGGGWPSAPADGGGWPSAEEAGGGGWPSAPADGGGWPSAEEAGGGGWPSAPADGGGWPSAEDAGGGWPSAEAAGGADPGAWPTAAGSPEESAMAWPSAEEAGVDSNPGAWPTAADAPEEAGAAWPEGGDAWPEGAGQPDAAPAGTSEPEDGKKGKKAKKKKGKKEKKPKKPKKPRKSKKKKGAEGGEGEAGEGEEAGGKKKIPLLLILIPAAVVAAAAVVLIILKPWAPKDLSTGEDTEQTEPGPEEVIEVNQPDDSELQPADPVESTPTETRTEPMNTSEAINRFASFSPASLGLEGEDMSAYRYYATGKTTKVDGHSCREIMVYSVNESTGTNVFAGRFLLSSDSSKLYRDDGNGVITELSPSIIGIGN